MVGWPFTDQPDGWQAAIGCPGDVAVGWSDAQGQKSGGHGTGGIGGAGFGATAPGEPP